MFLLSKSVPCGCFNSFNNQDVDFLWEFEHWVLILNHEQSFLGRGLLILKRHCVDLVELTMEEVRDWKLAYHHWRAAVMEIFKPDKINIAQLGNEESLHRGHLHWHFVPRYRRPISFNGVNFQHDTPETRTKCFSVVHQKKIHPPEMRQVIQRVLRVYIMSRC